MSVRLCSFEIGCYEWDLRGETIKGCYLRRVTSCMCESVKAVSWETR